MNAPQEPDWSDLDPEGRAFAYQPSDWARLVSTFAETGELIHPRFERRERALSELPELPIAYAESAPFIAAGANTPMPYPVEEGGYADDEPEAEAEPRAAPSRRKGGRRGLATRKRAAK
jgi:HemY protein